MVELYPGIETWWCQYFCWPSVHKIDITDITVVTRIFHHLRAPGPNLWTYSPLPFPNLTYHPSPKPNDPNPKVWHLCCKVLVLLQERCQCVRPYFDILNHSWTGGNTFVNLCLPCCDLSHISIVDMLIIAYLSDADKSMVTPGEYHTSCSQKRLWFYDFDIQTCIAIQSSVFTYSNYMCTHTHTPI